ncbi:MAG: putative oxidoreductase [Acidimicrobiales bacterium]|nr:putative oxidoreductase [Acidimicrobiales bacterium]
MTDRRGGRSTLVVVVHPVATSFTHAMAAAATRGLERAGRTVTTLDLYAMGFRPAMTEEERHAYHGEEPVVDPLVAESVAAVRDADMLVFVYPTWSSGLPAMLKGWLEKTMVPGLAFVFDASGKVRPGLQSVRSIVGVTTYGSSRAHMRAVNDNGRRILLRALRLNTGWRTKRAWLPLYRADHATVDAREAFLARIEREMAAT